MNRHEISVIGARPGDRYVESILVGVFSARTTSEEEIAADRPGERGPVLVVVQGGQPRARTYQLVDRMLRSLTPGVVLVDRASAQWEGLAGDGVIVVDRRTPVAMVQGMLVALAERQAAVRSLCGEIEVAERARGGVHGEMTRIHDEMNLAAMVQQELLPRELPEAPGYDIGIIFRPASYVSGDIYGIGRLDEERLGFFVADAVGHGVPAALMTMVISRALKIEDGIGPGEALARLNAELSRGSGGAPRFATAVHGTIELSTRRVTLASAGHPAPLRMGGGEVTPCACEGPLLGVFPDEKFEEFSFELSPGETLLVYSDGFETAFPDAHRRGTTNYLRHLAGVRWPGASHDGTLADSLGELARRLDAEDGSLHRVDDVTAMAICALDDAGAARRAA